MARMKARGAKASRSTRRAATDGAISHALAAGSIAAHATGQDAAEERVPASWAAFVNSFASQDWLLIGYLSAILAALVFGKGSNRGVCIVHVAGDLGAFMFVLALVRLQLLRWGGAASSLLYRTAIMATLLGTFFQLREILPAVSPWAMDARIYAFDLHVFGFEPSVWLDRFVNESTTEWFAFFYFLYFLILTVHVLPMLYWLRDERVLARFGVGFLLIFLTAHLLYMVVPGWGPYWYLRDSFQHELHGATFWPLVREAVDAGGAQKDIFPSLHTAVPTFIAIFSFRNRRLVPFKYTWWVMAFVATQIIIATLFLRWHYLVDVVAGLTLATTAAFLGPYLADWEAIRRDRMGIQPAWMPLAFPWTKPTND
jgi:membrane-associated phospholipid phosphatase